MSEARRGGVVVDTMVISWLFDERPNPLADRYREPHRPPSGPARVPDGHGNCGYGALRAGWGDLRRRRLEPGIAELTVIQADDHTTLSIRILDSHAA